MHRIPLAIALSWWLTSCAHHPSSPSAGNHPGHHHRFDDAHRWAQEFEDPSRDSWQKPTEVIAALALPSQAVVADLGAGTGYFSVRLAAALPQGRIWGLDAEPEMTRYLDARARKEGLPNLRAVQVPAHEPKFPEPVDLVLIVNTYHHLDARPAYLSQMASSLKPGGRVAIIDYTAQAPRGPPPHARLSVEQVVSEFATAGYSLAGRYELLPHQYFLVFSAPAR